MATRYVALFTAGGEVSGAGYARKPVVIDIYYQIDIKRRVMDNGGRCLSHATTGLHYTLAFH
jgi:hypothetical protein